MKISHYCGAALLVIMASGCKVAGMSGTTGTVLETGTGNPVAGVTVILECRRGKFPEGSEKVRELQAITDKEGHYTFRTQDLLGCNFAYVNAVKVGYTYTAGFDLRYGHDDYSTIPERIVLTPVNDVTMQRLNFLISMAKATSSPTPWYHYMVLFGDFAEAKRIAKEDQEIAYVATEFCPLLIDLYSTLPEQDRNNIHGQSVMSVGGVPTEIDHEGEVEPYCKRSGI